MEVFTSNSRPHTVWGPLAAINVSSFALDGLIGAGKPWVLVDFKANAKEIVDVVQCFNDAAFIYALGNDQQRCLISMTFLVFISKCEDDKTDTLQQGMEKYKSNRISQHTSAGEISIGNFARKGWLIGIDIGNADPQRSACYATVNFMMKL